MTQKYLDLVVTGPGGGGLKIYTPVVAPLPPQTAYFSAGTIGSNLDHLPLRASGVTTVRIPPAATSVPIVSGLFLDVSGAQGIVWSFNHDVTAVSSTILPGLNSSPFTLSPLGGIETGLTSNDTEFYTYTDYGKFDNPAVILSPYLTSTLYRGTLGTSPALSSTILVDPANWYVLLGGNTTTTPPQAYSACKNVPQHIVDIATSSISFVDDSTNKDGYHDRSVHTFYPVTTNLTSTIVTVDTSSYFSNVHSAMKSDGLALYNTILGVSTNYNTYQNVVTMWNHVAATTGITQFLSSTQLPETYLYQGYNTSTNPLFVFGSGTGTSYAFFEAQDENTYNWHIGTWGLVDGTVTPLLHSQGYFTGSLLTDTTYGGVGVYENLTDVVGDYSFSGTPMVALTTNSRTVDAGFRFFLWKNPDVDTLVDGSADIDTYLTSSFGGASYITPCGTAYDSDANYLWSAGVILDDSGRGNVELWRIDPTNGPLSSTIMPKPVVPGFSSEVGSSAQTKNRVFLYDDESTMTPYVLVVSEYSLSPNPLLASSVPILRAPLGSFKTGIIVQKINRSTYETSYFAFEKTGLAGQIFLM